MLTLILSASVIAAHSSAPSLASFSLRLFSRLAHEPDTFISPPSIATALLLAALGATPDSRTTRQFEIVLGGPAHTLIKSALPDAASNESGVTLQLANSAWVHSSISPAYRMLVENALSASVFPLPATASPVNTWVDNATQGEISKLFDSISADTRALLVSAVFFNGRWNSRFDPADTMDALFTTNSSGIPAVVRMMTLRNGRFSVGRASIGLGRWVNLIDLPYGDETYTATVVLPDEGTPLGDVLKRLREDGAVETWNAWLSRMSMRQVSLLQLPRFRLEYGTKSLKGVLQDMGLKDAFNSSILNQFLAMSRDPRLYISDVVHKATVDVTEEGTKASAATGVIIMTRSARPKISFIVDRPFLFFIRDRRTGRILFAGRIDNPKSPAGSEETAVKRQGSLVSSLL